MSAHDEAVEAAVEAGYTRMREGQPQSAIQLPPWKELPDTLKAGFVETFQFQNAAYLRHMRAAGFVQMPAEATEGMETACIKASLAFLVAHKIKAIWPWSRNRSHVRENIRVCYRAMVHAVEVPE